MKLSSFYRYVVEFGRQQDPRPNKKRIRSYADTAILCGRPDTDVKKIMVGVDIEVGELLLADSLRRAKGLDLVIAHHPEGHALAMLFEVMQLQVDMLVQKGINRKVAQSLLDERKREVERRLLPNNNTRSVDAARILDIPFICMHTPADNHAYSFIKTLLDKSKPKEVGDIIDILKAVPEYKQAMKDSVGPRIILGNSHRPVGKMLVEMTGGTEGSRDVFDKLYKVGIRTLVCMHLSEDHLKKVKDANLNVVIAGHISSDTLGLNLLLDKIEKQAKHPFQVTCCSGFVRIKRN